jgi:hypothetical protein
MEVLGALLIICVAGYVLGTSLLWTLAAFLGRGHKKDILIDEEAMEILCDLVNHGYCPRDDGETATCAGCDEAIDRARKWLTTHGLLEPEDMDE